MNKFEIVDESMHCNSSPSWLRVMADLEHESARDSADRLLFNFRVSRAIHQAIPKNSSQRVKLLAAQLMQAIMEEQS